MDEGCLLAVFGWLFEGLIGILLELLGPALWTLKRGLRWTLQGGPVSVVLCSRLGALAGFCWGAVWPLVSNAVPTTSPAVTSLLTAGMGCLALGFGGALLGLTWHSLRPFDS